MTEQASHNPEQQMSPTEQGWTDLYEAWQIPGENRELLSNYFETVVEEAKAKAADPNFDDIIDAGADLYRWILFSERGDSLPPSLALYDSQVNVGRTSLKVGIHPEHPAARAGRYEAIDVFGRLAGEKLAEVLYLRADKQRAVAEMAGEQPNGIARKAESLAKATDVYALLKSFDDIVDRDEERPLNQQELHMREVASEQQIRRKFGMDDKDEFVRGTPAANEYQRMRLHLEDEVVTDDKKHNNRPEIKARQYFIEQAQAGLRKDGHRTESVTYHDGVPVINYRADSPLPFGMIKRSDSLNDILVRAAQSAVEETLKQHGRRGEETDLIEHALLASVLERLNGKMPWNLVLRRAVYKAADKVVEVIDMNQIISDLHSPDQRLMSLRFNVTSPYWVSLLRPEGPVFDGSVRVQERALPIAGLIAKNKIDAQINDKESSEALLRTPFATVIRRGAAADDVHSRLITSFGGIEDVSDIPTSATDADLQLELADLSKGTPYLSIPGYILVAFDKNTGRYQFRSNLDAHDPYSPISEIDLPKVPYARRFLADRDMTAAADRLPESGASVQDIVNAIRDTSDYVFTPPVQEKSFGWDLMHNPWNVPVVDGRAQVQCTGANLILRETLASTFGGSSVKMISGKVLHAGDGVISQMGHAEVMFSYDGKLFMLDATPASSEITVPGQRTIVRQRLRDRLLRSGRGGRGGETMPFVDVTPTTSPDRPKKIVKPQYESISDYREATQPSRSIEDIQADLQADMQRLLQVRGRKALVEQVVKLKDGDPIRRTLSAFVQGADNERLEGLREYLVNYKSKPQVARQHGLKVYGPVLMDTLIRAVDEFSAAGRR